MTFDFRGESLRYLDPTCEMFGAAGFLFVCSMQDEAAKATRQPLTD